MKILFTNAQILDFDKESLVLGSVEIDGDIISRVGTFDRLPKYDRVIDCKGNILMPGFVNAHAHTAMTILRSINDNTSLHKWLFDNVLPIEAKFTPEDIYYGQYLGVIESVRSGITTTEEGYYHNDQIDSVAKKSGIRARLGIGPSMQNNGMSNVEYLAKCAKQIKNDKLVQTNCFVHSIYTTSKKAIEECVEFSKKHNTPLSIHLAETQKEVSDCLKEHNTTPTEYLNSLGFFDRPCLCYHAVHMTDKDITILNEKSVSVATCPSSNLKLGSGIAPVFKMHDMGINICIGTDGVASNNSLDMFKEMFLVATLNKMDSDGEKYIPTIEVLKMATLNGAKALGIDAGEIKAGKSADIILIDINNPHYYPQDNLISHLVYAGKSSDVYLTMVAGKILYENGEYHIGTDKEEIYKKINIIRRSRNL